MWARPDRAKVGRDGDDRGRRSQAEEGRALLLLEVQTWQTGRLNHALDRSIFVLPYFEGMVILPETYNLPYSVYSKLKNLFLFITLRFVVS